MKAEHITTKFVSFTQAVQYVKDMETDKTQTTYDGGLWINRVAKITITFRNGYWYVIESMKKRVQ